MPKAQRPSPADLTESWPDTPSLDPAGETARLLAITLRRSMGKASIRSVADTADLDEGTLRNVLSGARWPDLRTIARLEDALGVPLWPEYEERGGLW